MTTYIYLTNAFSLNMIPSDVESDIKVKPITLTDAISLADGAISAIGHQSTADILSTMLRIPVPMSRISVKLDKDSAAIVCQYSGPRLDEGITTLPEGAVIRFFLVSVQ